MEDPDHQVGAHFEALDEGVLIAALKSAGYFFPISIFPEGGATHAQLCKNGDKGSMVIWEFQMPTLIGDKWKMERNYKLGDAK